MSQTRHTFVSGSTGTQHGGMFGKVEESMTAIETQYSGTSFPTSPAPKTGQRCYRTDRGEKGIEYTFTGNASWGESGWVESNLLSLLGPELVNARGSKPSLDARLDVALHDDGSLKAGTSLNPSEWITLSGQTYAYVSTTQFTVTGNQTDIFTQYRRVKINRPGGTYFSEVVSSVYRTLTTVTILDAVLNADFTSIDHSIINTAGSGRGSVTAKSVGSIQADVANDFTASQKLKGDALRLRLLDSGSGGKEFSVCSDGGAVTLDENTGSEGTPSWSPRFTVAPDFVTGGVPVRRCVMRAALDANGRNNAISAGTGLAVNLAATATPFVVTVPYGFDSFARPIDYLHSDTADITGAWSSLTANTTNYLYYKRSSAGTWSRGATTLAPEFGRGTAERPGSPSNGQLYYDYSKAKWDIFTDSWAEQTDTYVFCGEAVTDSSGVTSVRNYAIHGRYNSGAFSVSGASSYTKDTNIGERFNYKILLNDADHTTTFFFPYGSSSGCGASAASQTHNTLSFNTGVYPGFLNGYVSVGCTYRILAERSDN